LIDGASAIASEKEVGTMRKSLVGFLVLFAAAISGCDADRTASAQPALDDVVAQPADMEAVSIDLALSAASAYFAAFNNGDADALMALLPAEATLSDSIAGDVTRESWERRLAWNIAQGTRFATPDCTVPVAGDSASGTVVRCESATLNAQIQAVGAHPVPTTIVLSVTPNGIQEVREEYGQPDFLLASEPFEQWLERTHPADAGRIGFGVWESIAEARENGRRTAEYARLWAADLEASCRVIPGLISPDRDSYLDDC
jgi:hypothetical protein